MRSVPRAIGWFDIINFSVYTYYSRRLQFFVCRGCRDPVWSGRIGLCMRRKLPMGKLPSDAVEPTVHNAWKTVAGELDKLLWPRLQAVLEIAERGGLPGIADDVLRALVPGYIEAFDVRRFWDNDDPAGEPRRIRLTILDALHALSASFESTVSAAVWNVLAKIATTAQADGPSITISQFASDLKLPACAPHAIMCAIARIPRLQRHIDTVISGQSGCVLEFDPVMSQCSLVRIRSVQGGPGRIECAMDAGWFAPTGIALIEGIVVQTAMLRDFHHLRGLGIGPFVAEYIVGNS